MMPDDYFEKLKRGVWLVSASTPKGYAERWRTIVSPEYPNGIFVPTGEIKKLEEIEEKDENAY